MASSSRNSQVDHQWEEDMSRAAGGDPERPVCNVVLHTPLMIESEETPGSTPNNTVPTQDEQQQNET
eukprot:15349198-Ditylum_brightwellii.AAC.1